MNIFTAQVVSTRNIKTLEELKGVLEFKFMKKRNPSTLLVKFNQLKQNSTVERYCNQTGEIFFEVLENQLQSGLFLADSGAEISINNLYALRNQVRYQNIQIDWRGMGQSSVKTLGLCEKEFLTDSKDLIKHKFHIVNDKELKGFRRGILCFDFIMKHKIIMNMNEGPKNLFH